MTDRSRKKVLQLHLKIGEGLPLLLSSEGRCERYIRNREGRDDETRHLSPRTQNTHGTQHEEHRVRLRSRKTLATTNASACCEGARVHAQVLVRALDGCNWAPVTEFIAAFRALNGREINHD